MQFSPRVINHIACRRLLAGAIIALAYASTAAAQQDTTAHPTTGMPGMPMPIGTATKTTAPPTGNAVPLGGDMGGMTMMTPDPLGVSMDRMGSGTTWVPEAAPIPSLYFAAHGRWDVTLHGFAFAQYDQQGGPLGGHQFGSLNWMMLMASHALAGGRFQARTMLSLDALGVTNRGYPLLLQPGEAYNGKTLYNRQHPHDLLMELSALYERKVTHSLGVTLYVAPSGEPALGPVAFMHRPSATDNPTAPLGHPRQDETHVTFGVLSAGLFTHTVKLEASIFNGRDPDQSRFDVDPIRLNSYSGRITFNPTSAWSFTSGFGYVKSPDALDPTVSMHRMTASVLYGSTFRSKGQLSASAVFGADKHSTDQVFSRAVLLESEAIIDTKNTVFVRAEQAQNTAADLGLDTPRYGLAPEFRFSVSALSLGFIREVVRFGNGTLGLGAMGTLNMIPSTLSAAYGSRAPVGAMVFLRLRPIRSGMRAHGAL